MKDMIAFMLVLLFAGFADGLMDKGIAAFLVVGMMVLGTAGALVCIDWRKSK